MNREGKRDKDGNVQDDVVHGGSFQRGVIVLIIRRVKYALISRR